MGIRTRTPAGGSVELVPDSTLATDKVVKLPSSDIAGRDFCVGGDGYSWVDETANRAIGTTYTNTTGETYYGIGKFR